MIRGRGAWGLVVVAWMGGCTGTRVPLAGEGHEGPACTVCEVPNTCCGAGAFEWCSAETCEQPVATWSGDAELSLSAQWSPVDDYVLSGGIDQLRLLEFDRGTSELTERASVVGLPGRVLVSWSSDGRFALAVSSDLRLYSVSRDPAAITEVARRPIGRDLYAVAWSPDDHSALVTGEDGLVRLFAVNGPTGFLQERIDYLGHAGKVYGTAWSPDGQHAVSVGMDGTTRLLAVDLRAPSLRMVASVTDLDQVWSVSWSPVDGVVRTGSGSLGTTVHTWSVDLDLPGLRKIQDLEGHTSGIKVLAENPVGGRLMTGGHDDTLRLWDAAGSTYGEIDVWGPNRHGIHDFSWSPDGTMGVVAASQCDTLTVLDMEGCGGL